ncbi:MAG TPA: hypothetical protein VEC56_03015 [Candidatus Krumholzibacteria bacterium]|nr:hypothetical protein [Candidatus Krumholzibacteria bacterium]
MSAIGDMRAVYRPSESAAGVGSNELTFDFEELELALNAYLNPYMRADVFLSIHGTGPEVEIEEANFTVLRGLPAALQFNAGQYLLDFGKLNTQHPHQWAWLDRPLMHRTMLGEDGLRALGARLTTLFAVGENALGLSASAFSGGAFESHEHGDEGEEDEAPPDIMGSARASLFRQVSDAWSAELGASYLFGNYDPVEPLATQIAAVDWKLRWRPNSYQAFVWVAEAMSSEREVAEEIDSVTVNLSTVDAMGAFTSAELQFRKRWSAGAFFDWTQDASIQDAESTAYGAFFDFLPVEETARIGIVYRHETSDLTDFDDDSVTLQFLWSLGPHKVHTF